MNVGVGTAVDFDPGPTYDRIQRYRRFLRSRLIGLVITVAILTGITIWQRERVPLRALIVGDAVVLGISLLVLAITWWLYRRARSAVATLGEGIAVQVDRAGVEVVGRRVPWHEVARCDTVRGPLALGPRFRVQDRAGTTLMVPWDQLATRPAGLDSIVRAYSGGRFGVDLSQFDA